VNGSSVAATGGGFAQPGSPTGVGPGRFVGDEYFGQVGGLSGTAPNLTFTLTQGPLTTAVLTNPATVIVNGDGSPDPVLTAGEPVSVLGKYDPVNKVVDAKDIIILKGGSQSGAPEVQGVVESPNAQAGTFDISIAGAKGFLPSTSTVQVTLGTSTTIVDASGVTITPTQFFADLTAGTTTVGAKGPISNGVMQATFVQISPSSGGSREAVLGGNPSNINATAGTFDMSAPQFEGMTAGAPGLVHIVTNAKTQFVDSTPSSFFSSLTTSTTVVVGGQLDLSTMTLTASQINVGHGISG